MVSDKRWMDRFTRHAGRSVHTYIVGRRNSTSTASVNEVNTWSLHLTNDPILRDTHMRTINHEAVTRYGESYGGEPVRVPE